MKSFKEIAASFDRPEGQDPPITGQWHNLQIRPDLGSGELLNVGVAFVDGGQRVHLKMADDLSRLRCFYDDRVDVASFETLADLIGGAFNGARLEDFHLAQLSAHAQLSEGRYAAGATIADILNGFFEATVPIARPYKAIDRKKRASRSRNISSEDARDDVLAMLLDRMGSKALPYITRQPWVFSQPGGRDHKLEIPIRKPGVLSASIVSVWYKDEWRRKFQLVKAGLDLNTVREQSPGERLGLFVMRPIVDDGYTERELEAIDAEIDETSWQLSQVANINVEMGENASELSVKLEDWLLAA